MSDAPETAATASQCVGCNFIAPADAGFCCMSRSRPRRLPCGHLGRRSALRRLLDLLATDKYRDDVKLQALAAELRGKKP